MRKALEDFAERMERKLAANDWKGGWQHERLPALHERLLEEAAELYDAWMAYPRDTPESAQRIADEAADVANFAMMIADNALQATQATGPSGARQEVRGE